LTFVAKSHPQRLAYVDHERSQGEKYRVSAYDSIVTIVEPEVSIYDFKLCVMIPFLLLPVQT